MLHHPELQGCVLHPEQHHVRERAGFPELLGRVKSKSIKCGDRFDVPPPLATPYQTHKIFVLARKKEKERVAPST